MDKLDFYAESERNALQLEYIFLKVTFVLLGICLVLYLAAFIKLLILYFKIQQANSPSYEVLLFLQTFFILAYKVFVVVLYNFYPPATKTMFIVANIVGMLEQGYHPYLYLVFNRYQFQMYNHYCFIKRTGPVLNLNAIFDQESIETIDHTFLLFT